MELTAPEELVRDTSLEQCTITSRLCMCSWNSVPLMMGTLREGDKNENKTKRGHHGWGEMAGGTVTARCGGWRQTDAPLAGVEVPH